MAGTSGKLQSEIAYEKINDMILNLELLPGEHISESALSQRFQISRTPIRDGLKRLEKEGLVTISKNRGASVVDFSEKQIKEIGHVRLAQDILSIQLALYYGSEADFALLNQLADVCEQRAVQGDVVGRIRGDTAFHLAITRISGNQLLLRQQRTVYQLVHLIQVRKYSTIADSMEQIYHHKPLVSALRRRDEATAVRLCCEHLREFYSLDQHILNGYITRAANKRTDSLD